MKSRWWEQAIGGYDCDEIGLVNSVARQAQSTKKSSVSVRFVHESEPLTRMNIPVWCNIRGTKLTGVDRTKATYVLGGVRVARRDDVSGFGVERVCKDNVTCRTVVADGLTLLYVKTNQLAAHQPAYVRRTISAMYSLVDGYDFNDWDGTRFLRRLFKVDRSIIVNAALRKKPVAGEFVANKISAEHHTHFRPEEVWEVIEQHKTPKVAASIVLDNLRRIEGVTEAVVSTFLLYMLYCRPQLAYLLSCSTALWEVRDVGALVSVLKEVSTPLKSVHNRDVCDYSQLFELTALINRGVGQIDWEAEKQHRILPDVIEIAPEVVYQEARKVFDMGSRLGYRYKKMTLDKYIASRWEWVPTGSVHSQYHDDAKYIKKSYLHRNKFVTLNMMPKEHIEKMMARKPAVEAWASVKYEWAKMRAIYGVDLTSTVITNFAMYRCEEALKHKFPLGEEAAADRVHRRLKMMLSGAESFCYDFDDFNAQHSTKSMQTVLIAYADAFKSQMSEEQKRAMEWVIASVDNVHVNNNEGGRGERYRVRGSLLSGWRLTTFINTVLNYIYFKGSGALNAGGVVDSVHNGDDVLLSIRNIRAAVEVHDRMARINARAQPTKCNVYSIGEFLRVEHKIDMEKGLGAQYLARGMATLAHSRVESQAPTRLCDAVKAMVTRCEEASQRSTSAALVSYDLLQRALKRLATVFSVGVEDAKLIAESHVIVGGALTSRHARIDTLIKEKIEYDERDDVRAAERGDATIREMEAGIVDYARLLKRQYPEFITFQEARKRVIRATERQISVTRRTWLVKSDVSSDIKYSYGRELFREYRHIVSAPHLEKARFVGVSPIALLSEWGMRKVKTLLSGAKDVSYVLSVLL